ILLYVNQKFELFPQINSTKLFLGLNPEQRFSIHSKLYDNIKIIDTFLVDNPDQLTPEQLTIASQFKRFVRGDFFVERFLTKYTIFIDEKNKVYGVLGLTEPLNEMIDKSYLPLNIYTTLLPFKDKIIYDGLFKSRNILFGSGIKGELKEIYMAAKQCNRIIETLAKPSSSTRRKKQTSNKELAPVINELKKSILKISLSSDDPAILKPTLSMLKSSLMLLEIAADSPNNWAEIDKISRKVLNSVKQVEKVIERGQRYE
ncbi:MAG: hypothetical protein ACKO2V_18400, partial [Snowella sp.]